jgi:hypothetical protein
VTDIPPEKPPVARSYCPGCEPFADAMEEVLDVQWCDDHLPAREGADDALVTSNGTLFGSAEAGGDGNRLWCELLHRAEPEPARPTRGRRTRRLDP